MTNNTPNKVMYITDTSSDTDDFNVLRCFSDAYLVDYSNFTHNDRINDWFLPNTNFPLSVKLQTLYRLSQFTSISKILFHRLRHQGA